MVPFFQLNSLSFFFFWLSPSLCFSRGASENFLKLPSKSVMETESCAKKMKNEVNLLVETSSLEKIRVVETKDVELLKVVDGKVAIGPITPNPDRENVDGLLDCISPLTWVSSTTEVTCPDSSRTDETAALESAPQTPKEDVFDSFAPGPDALMLAPRVRKYFDEARQSVSRRLVFDDPEELKEGGGENDATELLLHEEGGKENDATELLLHEEDGKENDATKVLLKEEGDKENDATEVLLQEEGSGENDGTEVPVHEEVLLESMYESILDAIVSKQAEVVVTETRPWETDSSEDPQTPTSLPLLTGIAETCPPTPMKPVSSSRKVDLLGVCRKLEF